MRQILYLLFGFVLIATLVVAVDFTPQGNINLRGIFNITNGSDATFSEVIVLDAINMTSGNITSVSCLLFDSGGKICSS